MKILEILFRMIRLALAPNDYARVEKFRTTLRRHKYFDMALNKVNADEGARATMREKPLFDWDHLVIENLKKLPDHTLGHRFQIFLAQNGLQLLNYQQDPQLTDEEYFIRRVVQTHDLWHVVLGYESDELGEIGINSFMLAQIAWPPAGFYIGGYIIRQMLRAPQEALNVLNVVTTGWALGRTAKPLFAVKWEDELETPLSEIRERLNIDPR